MTTMIKQVLREQGPSLDLGQFGRWTLVWYDGSQECMK